MNRFASMLIRAIQSYARFLLRYRLWGLANPRAHMILEYIQAALFAWFILWLSPVLATLYLAYLIARLIWSVRYKYNKSFNSFGNIRAYALLTPLH